jgi:hypothetical protein
MLSDCESKNDMLTRSKTLEISFLFRIFITFGSTKGDLEYCEGSVSNEILLIEDFISLKLENF